MKIILPKNVSYIINVLEENGYEAFAVGGCVRDILLGREPEDWDITTSAKPEQVKELFRRTIDTGLQHGTVTVMLDGTGYEVTTYRIDGEYEDNRHPKSVEFTGILRLDLERRDFTINAMAYNDSVGLVDEFGGVEDLKNGIIRCVGDAGQRFDEDALRMLRAVRFSGQLGFSIEKKTREAIVERVKHLENISAERIRVELTKLIISKGAGQFSEAYHTGMTAVFLPEYDGLMEVKQNNPHHVFTVGVHSVKSVEIINSFFGLCHDEKNAPDISEEVRNNIKEIVAGLDKKRHIMLSMTMLLHDIAKPLVMKTGEDGISHFYTHPEKSEEMAADILRRLTFDNESVTDICRLIRHHDYRIEPTAKSMRRASAKIGRDIMPMLFLVQYADVYAQNPATFEEKLYRINSNIILYREMIANQTPLSLKELKISGKDLINLGVKPGPSMGDILGRLLDMVIDEPELNDRNGLISKAKQMIN